MPLHAFTRSKDHRSGLPAYLRIIIVSQVFSDKVYRLQTRQVRSSWTPGDQHTWLTLFHIIRAIQIFVYLTLRYPTFDVVKHIEIVLLANG